MKNIFKKIKYIIFILIYGKVKYQKSNFLNYNIIKKVKINNKVYKIFELTDVRIYTNTNDVAYIDKKNNIIDGPSIQIRSNRYSHIRNNSILNEGTPKILTKLHNRTFSLLCGAHGNNNYFHWFFDVLPRIYIFKKKYKINNNDIFLVPSLKHNYQRQSLKILGIKNPISAYTHKHFKSKKVITTFFDAVNKGKDIMPKWTTDYISKKFTKNIKSRRGFIYQKIYIDRKDSASNDRRKIINENEIKRFLTQNKFKSIILSDLSFDEELSVFNNAKIVIGLYGAGLTNFIFMKNNKKVIEIKHKKTGNLYKNIALFKKLKYSNIICNKFDSYSQQKRKFDGMIYCSLNQLKKALIK